MRVGLFGGSFNPAHEGHAHVAQTAMARLGLDRVIWLVSPQNPLKDSHETAGLAARITAAKRFARGPRMIVSGLEASIGSRFTLDTLRVLKARYPKIHFVWIMGADSLAGFHRWRGWTQIMNLVPMAVVSRPWAILKSRGSPAALRFRQARRSARVGLTLAQQEPPAWVYLRGPLHYVSSTALRKRTEARVGS